MTGYTNTLTGSTFSLTVSAGATIRGIFSGWSTGTITVTGGGVTLAATATGAAFPIINITTAAQTLTSGGFTWGGNLTLAFGGNITLSGAWNVTGLVTIGAATTMVGSYLMTAGSMSIGAFTLTLVNAWTVTGTLTTSGNATINGVYTFQVGGLTLGNNLSGTTTITMTGGTWSGNFSLASPITFAGTVVVSGIVQHTTGAMTWSSGTIDWVTNTSTLNITNSFTISGAYTFAFYNITGTGGTLTNSTGNAFTINSAGTLTIPTGSTFTTATLGFTINGTLDTGSTGIFAGVLSTMGNSSTWKATGWTTGYVSCPLTLGTNVSQISGSVGYRTGTLTLGAQYTSGIINIGASFTLTPVNNTNSIYSMSITGTAAITQTTYSLKATGTLTIGAALTMVGASMTAVLGTVSLGAFTWTLVYATTITNTLTISGAGTITGAYVVSVGGLTATNALLGTCTINFAGTGTNAGWSGSGVVTPAITFNASTTITGVVASKGNITRTTGTITTTSSTLTLSGACTLDTSAITWNNININTAGTYALASALNSAGILSINDVSVTFTGAYDIVCATFNASADTASRTIVFVAGRNLNVSTAINLVAVDTTAGANLLTIQSSTTSKFNINYSGTAANSTVTGVAFTWIDASASTIGHIDNWYGGTLSNTLGIINRTSANLNDIFGVIA